MSTVNTNNLQSNFLEKWDLNFFCLIKYHFQIKLLRIIFEVLIKLITNISFKPDNIFTKKQLKIVKIT